MDDMVRCATIAAPEDLLVAYILRSWRCSEPVCFLRVFCRVCNAVGRRTLDPNRSFRIAAKCLGSAPSRDWARALLSQMA